MKSYSIELRDHREGKGGREGGRELEREEGRKGRREEERERVRMWEYKQRDTHVPHIDTLSSKH